MELAGRNAVVTGGASGIGKAIAAELIARGAKVLIADIDDARLAAAGAELPAATFRCDLSKADQVQALADRAVAEFGKVDILCNNAGVGPVGPIAGLKPADWDWMMGINFFGVVYGINAFLPVLEKNPDGAFILNTASMAGYIGVPMFGAYSASKFAVVAVSETLSKELEMAGSKVKVGVLAPGPVETDIVNSKRYGRDPAKTGLADPGQEVFNDAPWMKAEEAARLAVNGIVAGSPIIATHLDEMGFLVERHRAIEAVLLPG